MQNRAISVSLHNFQQQLDSVKTKIQLQQSLAQSLAAEFESLTFRFESLKGLIGDTSYGFESLSENFGATSSDFESSSENFGATSSDFESSSENFSATSSDFDSLSENFNATSSKFESSSYHNGTTSIKSKSTLPNDGAATSIQELALLIQRSAKASLKIYYSHPNIPSRMAAILLALKAKKKLSVAEMRQITGASRNSLVRDIKVLKLLGWLQFHGSRKNGYFTLTASSPV